VQKWLGHANISITRILLAGHAERRDASSPRLAIIAGTARVPCNDIAPTGAANSRIPTPASVALFSGRD
jgi:hypothetical protein